VTEDELLEMGRVAEALLTDDNYMAFFHLTKRDILECIANTEPTDTARRELLYHQFNGLVEVLRTMQQYVDHAENVKLRRAEQEDID
jgi:hypothetical protein